MAVIHIVGAGALGLLKAHYLTKSNYKVVLILKDSTSLKRFVDNKNTIKLTTLHRQKKEGPAAVETFQNQVSGITLSPSDASTPVSISKLVVATKAGEVSDVLERALPFMTPGCQILLVQNGISAVYRRVHASFLARSEIRELGIQLNLAVVTHGAYIDPNTSYHVVHSGMGSLCIQRVDPSCPTLEDPRQEQGGEGGGEEDGEGRKGTKCDDCSSSTALAQAVVAAEGLGARMSSSYREFLFAAEAKLAGNAVINPLTAIFNCRNGDLLRTPSATLLFHSLASEVATIIAAASTAAGETPVEKEAYAQSLSASVFKILEITAANRTSMLQDILARRKTEIDFLTGHVLTLAKEKGVKAPISQQLFDFVKAKEELGALDDIYQ
uniref:2-dehydropantoate 2-reductase n=1 Tax=Polytomella parva TaxID=51329 RepID=A0A7S0UUX9_9CHLO